MRLFIAIGLPRRIREGLLRDNALVRSRCSRGSFTREENLHLTLAFIGETEPERLDTVKEAMDGAVLWRSLDGPGLSELQQALSEELEARGFPQEKRRFTPHLTIARHAVLRKGTELRALSSELTSSAFTAKEITLFLSEQADGVRKYTPLYRKELTSPADE